MSASTSGSGAGESELQELRDKYGSKADPLSLSKAQVKEYVTKALGSSRVVKHLYESLQKAGCGINSNFFHITKCDTQTGGGFSTEHGVILCQNRLHTYGDVEAALAHELVHAYDFCRAANLDFTNCRHHACTEIRAARLSGDCTLWNELTRGNLGEGLTGQQRRCIERRALLSVAMNPHCGEGRAEKAVAEMMDKCCADTEPFVATPRVIT